jgi:hypothetical protein
MLLLVVRGLFVACALSGFGAALFALTMPIAWDVDSRLHASIERQVGKIMSLSSPAHWSSATHGSSWKNTL